MTPRPDPPPLRIVLLGYGHLGLALLQGLVSSRQAEVVGVFPWSSRPKSRHFREPKEKEFVDAVKRMDLPEVSCAGVNSYEFVQQMRRLQPDVVLIGSWGEILKPHLLTDCPWHTINCHPSLLPAHRGANPYASVIIQGEQETGITFHLLSEEIDAGPILLQEKLAVTSIDTGDSLRQRCSALAEAMVPELLDILLRASQTQEPLSGVMQDGGSYFPPLKTGDGLLDWQLPAETLDRRIRALHPWIYPFSFLDGNHLVLFQDLCLQATEKRAEGTFPPGTILNNQGGVLTIATADPTAVVQIRKYQLYFSQLYWPASICRWILPPLFKPGRIFRSARGF